MWGPSIDQWSISKGGVPPMILFEGPPPDTHTPGDCNEQPKLRTPCLMERGLLSSQETHFLAPSLPWVHCVTSESPLHSRELTRRVVSKLSSWFWCGALGKREWGGCLRDEFLWQFQPEQCSFISYKHQGFCLAGMAHRLSVDPETKRSSVQCKVLIQSLFLEKKNGRPPYIWM